MDSLSELDTIEIFNPLSEDFTCRFNGQAYTIGSQAKKHYPHFLALHIAKHLSDKMLNADLAKVKKAKTDNPHNPLNAQLMIYDNPKRRITLFDILGSKEMVERCIKSKPFKGFIGIMDEYDQYVEKKTKKEEKTAATPSEPKASKPKES